MSPREAQWTWRRSGATIACLAALANACQADHGSTVANERTKTSTAPLVATNLPPEVAGIIGADSHGPDYVIIGGTANYRSRGFRLDPQGRLSTFDTSSLFQTLGLYLGRFASDGTNYYLAYPAEPNDSTLLGYRLRNAQWESFDTSILPKRLDVPVVDMAGAAGVLGITVPVHTQINRYFTADLYVFPGEAPPKVVSLSALGAGLRFALSTLGDGFVAVRFGELGNVAWQRVSAEGIASAPEEITGLPTDFDPSSVRISVADERILVFASTWPVASYVSWTPVGKPPNPFVRVANIADIQPIEGANVAMAWTETGPRIWRAIDLVDVSSALPPDALAVPPGSTYAGFARAQFPRGRALFFVRAAEDAGATISARLVDVGGLEGTACTDGRACANGLCVDGVCCDSPCDGPCQRCGANGTCGPVTSGTDDACMGSRACGSDGRCLPTLGQACAEDTDCVTGFCAAGTCCRTRCAGGCETCETGVCAPVPKGTAGHGPICADATCSGVDGRCARERPTVCASETEADAPNGPLLSCAPYRCRGGSCLERCDSVYDCTAGLVCTPEGQCEAPHAASVSCQTHGHRTRPPVPMLLLLALLLMGRRSGAAPSK